MSSTSSLSSDEEVIKPSTSRSRGSAAAKAPVKVAAAKSGAKSGAKTKVKAEEEEHEDAPPTKKPRAKAAAKPKAKAGTDEADGEAKPKTKKKDIWPPTDLDPSSHPPRAGHPIYKLPPLTSAPNGGIAPSSSTPRPLFVGAHTSIAGGPATALFRAGKAGANGLAMFVKSQRQWKSNPFEQEAVDRFKEAMKADGENGMGYGPETILVHGSYLINLGNPDVAKWNTSYQCFKDDVARCHQLGVKMYNWHPGSTVGACTKEESYKTIAKAINQVHKEVPEVITVIENMANAKSNIIGTTFHDLASIIALVDDKTRVRICLDTCHLFSAGYDIRTRETYRGTMKKFDEEVGNGYLAGMHLNDSKADLGGCKDLHENIGLGHIGLTGFREIMRDPLMEGIPLILETPASSGNPLEVGELSLWTKEIQLLYEIQAIEDDEWEIRKGEIEQRWREERDRLNPPKEKKGKVKKEVKPAAKKGKKAKDEEACESHGEESD